MTTSPGAHQSAGDSRGAVVPPWVTVAAALLGAGLTLLAARITHAGVGPDAVAYIAVANSLREGTGIAFWLEDPLVTWPPLWPMVIAAGMAITGWRADVVGLVANSVLLAGCVFAAAHLARRVLHSRRLATVFVVAMGVSPLLIGLAVLVQTEIAFTLVVLVVMLAVVVHFETSRTVWLVVAGLVTAVGFYVRYQGLYVVPVFAVWIWLRQLVGEPGAGSALVAHDSLRGWFRSVGARRVLGSMSGGVLYSLCAVIPATLWVARNISLDEEPLGPRFPSDVGVLENALGALTTVFKFVTSAPTVPRLPAAALTLVAIVVAGWSLVRHAPQRQGRSLALVTLRAAAGWPGMLATFVVGFSALMVLSRSMVGFDDLDIRLLAPCMVPVILLALRYVEILSSWSPRLATLGRVLVVGWFSVALLVTLALVGPANGVLEDYGYNAPRAVAASRSSALEALPDGCVLYSNNAGDLYRSGIEAELSPRKVEYKSDQPTRQLEELVERVERGERACLLWVEYTDDPENYSLEEIAEVLDLQRLASADQLTTYVLAPR